MQEDPTLRGVDCVILDEFHERHIHTDTALALLRQIQTTTRPDLIIVVMSATLASSQLAEYFSGIKEITIELPMHPVRVDYLPNGSIENAVRLLLDDKACPGHILVFLPGVKEIENARKNLSSVTNVELLTLHGRMSLQEQRQVFVATQKRKIILATNIAETSVTIDGVTGVIDSGLARITGFAKWSGVQTLSLRLVSQAACIQRSGRAGRTALGVVKRLFSEQEFLQRPAFEKSEIHRTDLTDLTLELKALQSKLGAIYDIRKLPWLEPPEEERIALSERLLTLLGAVENNQITPLGKEMALLPLHPRLSRVLLEAKKIKCLNASHSSGGGFE